jgi:ATP-binding cassette subfamily F protein 3
VLLDALIDYGGTLIFVSHDRYFVDKLATKVINIGNGEAQMYPGTYEEFLWSRKQRDAAEAAPAAGRPTQKRETSAPKAAAPKPAMAHSKPQPIGAQGMSPRAVAAASATPSNNGASPTPISYDERKRQESEARKVRKAVDARRKRIDDLEARIADREQAIKTIEATMSAPGFYDNHETAKPVIDKHQALMWEVGDLMHQWEELQQTDL